MNSVILSSIIDIISGGTPDTSNAKYWDGNIGWLSVNDFKNNLRYVYNSEKKITELGLKNSSTNLLEQGDIIISARGTVGAIAQIGFPMCFNQSCFGIRGKKEKISTDYLYYALKNYIKNIIKRSQGSVFNTINLASFDLMRIQIHDLVHEQHKITKILSDLDKKIEINYKINSKLEAITKLIYDYWFVQFDFPDENGKPYKSSGGKMVYDENLKKEVPCVWSVRNISEMLKICSGYPFKSASYLNSGTYKIVTIKNVQDNKLVLDNTDLVNSIPSDIESSSILKLQDILISLTGNVGRICLVDEQNLLLNQRVGKFQTSPILKNYFYLTYQTLEFRSWLERISTGTSQKNLSPIEAVNRLHAFPDSSILIEFDQLVGPMIKKILSNLRENKKLESLRNWLLPMLMNDQIKVS